LKYAMSRTLTQRRGPDFSGISIVLGALALASFIGLLTAYLPWQFTLMFLSLPIILLLSQAQPMIGLVIVLMFIFEVVPSAFQPRLPFGGGKLQSSDLILLYLTGVVLMQAMWKRSQPLLAMGPIRFPLYYLTVCMVTSLVYVRYFAPNPVALGEARTAIGWLIVPLMALSADTPNRAKWMLRCVVATGLIIAAYVTIQSVFSVRIMTGHGLFAALDNSSNSDVVRSIAGGGIYIIVFALFLVINRVLERRLFWLWGMAAALVLISGIGVQFGRAVWMAAVVGLLVSAAHFRGFAGAIKVLAVGVFAVGMVMSAVFVFQPRLAQAIVQRAVGIGAELESGGSYGWRLRENATAIDRIQRSPLMGVGLGGQYKQTASAEGHFGNEGTYIHNGYLVFPLKMGVWATFIPLAFIIAFWVTVKQGLARQAAREDAGLAAALLGGFVVPVITSYTQPEWFDPRGIAAFATFMGLALLYRRFGDFHLPLDDPAAAGAGVTRGTGTGTGIGIGNTKR
jgi:hypothetical protein